MRVIVWLPILAVLAETCAGAPLTHEGVAKLCEPKAVLHVSPLVSAKSEAPISADVSGLDEVSLVTWTGGDSSSCDYADWQEARFEGDGGTVYVSDLPWSFAWGSSGAPWACSDFLNAQIRKDRSALDTGLSSGGRAFAKGIGVNAPALIVVKVPKGAKRLVARGQIDDVAATKDQGARASVQFIVLAGSPSQAFLALLDLPQVLPSATRAQIAALTGRCTDALVRDYEGMWKSLLFETRVQAGCFSREERDRQAYNASALILSSDRDPADIVARRTRALWNDLSASDDVKKEGQALAALEQAVRDTPVTDSAARTELYLKLCAVRRTVMFANPLLKGIDRLAFVTREALPPNEYDFGTHMADQYFGFHATLRGTTRGNGLYVLENPWSDTPKVRNLLADSVIESGARKGQKLGNGGYLAPDVSYDGKQILFCYTDGEPQIRVWNDQTTFHIFRCNADGSGLVQLTDGSVNDLDPCWLPNGRIVFISERRGGFGRCHRREVPTYTLHSMFEDGSDIVCLSPHETNEWQPSVDNNGMIVYTRWDYVDRGFNQAHHLWLTTPDGRDARELNGNEHRSERTAPHLVGDARAIPGSSKYIAVAGGHHTQTRGSLIVIDPSVADDGAMSQIRRFTPDQVLPEAEGPLAYDKASGAYASPWPLSEKVALCVYDPLANAQYGYIDWRARRYAIALIDAFGNKETLYTHPEISCLSPIPLRACVKPPVLAHATLVGRPRLENGEKPAPVAKDQLPKTAKVGLINVYNTRYPFPEGTKIKSLHVWQVLPKVKPMVGCPRLGVCDQICGRQFLGTVPVEADGSAYFEVPVGVEIFFHAVDDKGLAVQGMRSATYTAPGETLMCNGCHEQRVGVARAPSRETPLAMRRAPSAIEPGMDGTRPFNYPRLVQPVLDAKCVSCHGEKRKEKMPDLRKGNYAADKYLFYTSFYSLAPFVNYYTSAYRGNWRDMGVQRDAFVQPYTEPGKFGAYASPLYAMLSKGHHDVKLSDDEMRRLLIFMESNAAYFGHDDNIQAQAEGVIVPPVLQ
jgi:hypothetical protein